MTKGANTWNHKIKTAAFERLSTDATEARMLLAAVTAWLMDKGSSLDMVEVAWYMDETYFTAVSRFKKIKVMANKLIRDAHKSGRPKPTTYSTKKPPVSRKQRARTSTLGGTVTPNTVSPTASSRSSPKSFSPRKEESEQPTQRAIVEHIVKLKKTLGISGSQSSATANVIKKEPKSPRYKKQKTVSAPLTPPGSAGHDDNEQHDSDHDQRTVRTPAKKSANSRTPKGKPASKRQRNDFTDEEEPMTEGDDDEENDSVAQFPAFKREDDEFFMPGEGSSPKASEGREEADLDQRANH
ncbi:hypothetical protein DOTSEDRAFT_22804 [Dothistroma septosporum NZE10]|uniref:Uncharacterized protein n=1 Tax=Dothistroma septosporum (strain NZE10 / CBS 128990) TaxID=675120 RepID=N1PX31_DOTSN|nr:hypothetical protein DOTSEDRAFT_22804 [Dothistroma septosporum NZE10]